MYCQENAASKYWYCYLPRMLELHEKGNPRMILRWYSQNNGMIEVRKMEQQKNQFWQISNLWKISNLWQFFKLVANFKHVANALIVHLQQLKPFSTWSTHRSPVTICFEGFGERGNIKCKKNSMSNSNQGQRFFCWMNNVYKNNIDMFKSINKEVLVEADSIR